ncbi:Ig-like domain-containing protein, partial [Mesorhizobium japonicum]|uniref:Ig-like domain-containing protein n=1 Tax=Mesorhizobium japonicum TaxID=2066070 RepID=UPI003B5A7EE5
MPTKTVSIDAIESPLGVVTNFSALRLDTNQTQLLFKGSLSTPIEAGERVLFSYDNGANFYAATMDVNGLNWTYDMRSAPALGQALYELKVRVEDLAGNYNSGNRQLNVDTQAPTSTAVISGLG